MTLRSGAPALAARDPLYERGLALVFLSGTLMSIAGLVVRLIESANEWQILFYRALSLIATLLLVLTLRRRSAVVHAFRMAGWNGVLGGLCLAASMSCFIFALTHTTVANAVFLLSASPFLAAVLGWLVLGETVRRATWLAMSVALAGVAVMVGDGIASGTAAGSLAALFSALGFAGFTVALRRGRAVDMLPTVCLAGVYTAVGSAGILLVIGGGFAITRVDLGLCVLLGTVQVGAGLAVYTLGSRHVPAAELALLSLSEVVLNPLWVWLALGEVPGGLTVLGGAVLLTGLVGHAASGLRRWRPPVGAV